MKMNNITKYLCYFMLVVSVSIFLISCSPAQDPPANVPPASSISNVKIDLKTDKQTVTQGDTFFKVDVDIVTDTAIRGVQWKLNFDPRAMQLKEIKEGNFLKDWAKKNDGTTMIFPNPTIDNVGGSVSDMGIAVMSDTTGGATGSGTLCTYNFVALSDHVEMPAITDMLLCDETGKTFPYTFKP